MTAEPSRRRMWDDPTRASAFEVAEAILRRDVSSVEVVEACLRSIEQVGPSVNAVVRLAADALDRAREADEDLARGRVRGPLHGIPFPVKDVIDTAGVITTAGLAERAAHVPSADATVVARMKEAGGILLGKTNCPPGGAGVVSDNPVYGRTCNPYDASRVVGGSSGGEAAAVAAGCSPLGLGSDSGGSLRVPAHLCGVATLKPTTGRVPNTGAYEHPGGLSDPRTQIGPMARSVRDLGVALGVIAGPDDIDSGVVPTPLPDTSTVTVRGLRVATYVEDPPTMPQPEVSAAVRAAGDALSDAGCPVTPARPHCLPDARDVTERYWHSSELTGGGWEQLLADWDRFRTGMLGFMRDYDAILCPAEHRAAWRHDEPSGDLWTYTLPYSLCGWPCVVVRAGSGEVGLPVGVQIVARPWREDVALALAQCVEDALGGWLPAGSQSRRG